MSTKRQRNYPFSIQSLTISDYSTGEPIAARTFAGGACTLNVSLTSVMLEGNEFLAPVRAEIEGGQISFDATIKEAPMKLLQYGNQGSTVTVAACASAFTGTITAKTGSTITNVITAVAVSGSLHTSVLRDKIYIEALTTSTFKIVNYSKSLESGTIALSGAATRIVDADVAPGIQFAIESASAFTADDTAVFETTPIAGGETDVEFGKEKVCSRIKYVNVRAVTHNCSDDDHFEFELYKCVLTGTGAPMTQGDYMALEVHGDAQVDTSRTVEATANYKIIKGE